MNTSAAPLPRTSSRQAMRLRRRRIFCARALARATRASVLSKGQHLPSAHPAHAKRAHHFRGKIHGRSAPSWCTMKFYAAKTARLNAVWSDYSDGARLVKTVFQHGRALLYRWLFLLLYHKTGRCTWFFFAQKRVILSGASHRKIAINPATTAKTSRCTTNEK